MSPHRTAWEELRICLIDYNIANSRLDLTDSPPQPQSAIAQSEQALEMLVGPYEDNHRRAQAQFYRAVAGCYLSHDQCDEWLGQVTKLHPVMLNHQQRWLISLLDVLPAMTHPYVIRLWMRALRTR